MHARRRNGFNLSESYSATLEQMYSTLFAENRGTATIFHENVPERVGFKQAELQVLMSREIVVSCAAVPSPASQRLDSGDANVSSRHTSFDKGTYASCTYFMD